MSHLPLPDLESIYDQLAQAIDAAPPGQSEKMLVKLSLLLAQALGDRAQFEALLATAQQNL